MVDAPAIVPIWIAQVGSATAFLITQTSVSEGKSARSLRSMRVALLAQCFFKMTCQETAFELSLPVIQ